MLFDRNDFALALTMAVPMLFHLGWSEKREVLRRVALACVPLTCLTIVFTHSRGAFLSLGATVAALVWRSRNRLAGFAVMLLMTAALFSLAPHSYIERISTIGDFEEDSSARGRLDAWVVAGNMITANPILGVGYGKFERNYYDYDPKKALFIAGGTLGRVAHNSYLQIWAECGSLAFGLYMIMIAMTFFDTWRVRRMALSRYHASWIISYANMFEASMVGFVVGSFFLNRAHFDLLYHVIAISLSFGVLARKAMEDEVRYPRRVESVRGTLAPVRPAGFGRRPAVSGFRSTPLGV
jgi:probable O-glycosylation ligase (exosortase A-associated)